MLTFVPWARVSCCHWRPLQSEGLNQGITVVSLGSELLLAMAVVSTVQQKPVQCPVEGVEGGIQRVPEEQQG